MYTYEFHPLFRPARQVISEQWGDVTGDGKADYVYLTGTHSSDSPFTQNIQLHVRDGETGTEYTIELKDNMGYNPTIFLGDFTGNQTDDILVSIESGGSGAFTYNEVFTFVDDEPHKIYDNDWFYNTYSDATVTYEDFYKVRVVNRSLGQEYIVDIGNRDSDYLNQLYDENGKLKQPTEGSVNGVSGAYPIDLQNDGIYELWTFQRVTGLYNADGLGYLQTPLEWNNEESRFVPMYQMFAFFGSDTDESND